MKNHKEKYRLERIIRIQSKWSFGKATNANNRKHYSIRWSFYQPIYQFASLWDSMPTTSDSSMKKGCHLRIVSRVIYSATVEPSLLYGIKAISFTNLTESPQVEPSQSTHTSTSLKTFSIYRWNSDDPTKPGLQDYQIDPERLWANGPRCSEIILGRRIFLSLLTTKVWECKNGSLDFWGVVWAFGLLYEGFFFFNNLWKMEFLFY